MRPRRATSFFFIVAGASILAFLAGALTAPQLPSPQSPKKFADGPPGPCGPGTFPDRGVCIPVANVEGLSSREEARPRAASAASP